MKHRVFTDEHRRRISAAKKGVITPAIKAQVDRLHEQMRGRKQSPEEKEKRASKLRGRKRPAELMERIRLSNIGQKRTPEQCRKMSGPRKKKTAVAA